MADEKSHFLVSWLSLGTARSSHSFTAVYKKKNPKKTPPTKKTLVFDRTCIHYMLKFDRACIHYMLKQCVLEYQEELLEDSRLTNFRNIFFNCSYVPEKGQTLLKTSDS